MSPNLRVVLLLLSSIGLYQVHSQQQLEVAAGPRQPGGGHADLVRKVYYEYNPIRGRDNDPPGVHHRHPRPAGPFDGVIPGIFITVASAALHWWNEGRSVKGSWMLRDAERGVVELVEGAPIDPSNDGKLVHIMGDIASDNGLVDPVHGIHAPSALQLSRKTDAYQWKERKSETRTRVSETEERVEVTYRYHKGWTSKPIESYQFEEPAGHENPSPRLGLGSFTMIADDIHLSNGLHLPPEFMQQLLTPNFINLAGGEYEHSPLYRSELYLGQGEELANNDDAVITVMITSVRV